MNSGDVDANHITSQNVVPKLNFVMFKNAYTYRAVNCKTRYFIYKAPDSHPGCVYAVFALPTSLLMEALVEFVVKGWFMFMN